MDCVAVVEQTLSEIVGSAPVVGKSPGGLIGDS